MRTEERLSLQEAAEALGISEQTARRWVKTGKLKADKPGLRYLIPASAISELLPVTVPLKPLELRSELKQLAIAQIMESVKAGDISVEAGVEKVLKHFAA